MEAATTDEHRVLVIAGAGTGKTTTIVARIKYLLSIGVDSKSILCISFTNASVLSLKDKIKEETGSDIDVFTFHKLALNVLKDYNPKIANNALEYIVSEYFESLILDDKEMMYAVLKYINLFTFKINVFNKYKNIDYKILKQIEMLVIKFIHLMKTNGYDIAYFTKLYKKKFKTKNYYLLKLIILIYQMYEKELLDNNECDFDDLIIKASQNNSYPQYKYIFVDEFQDTSMIRFNLIKSLLSKDSYLFVVGDDFQSIYKFSGCNLSIMLDFDKYFPNSKTYKITNTYRFSKELIDVTSKFILKNKRQIKKELKSSKHIDNPIQIYRYKNYKNDFKKLIDKISVKNSILLLGRYQKDIYKILDEDYTIDRSYNVVYKPTGLKMQYMTIHKSKGLEADTVIIINLLDEIMGFPSKIEDAPILKLVSPMIDDFPYSEERRLFYVALTRTRNYVYLYVPFYNASKFIKELQKN